MNRAQRRKQPHSKSNLRIAGLTYLTVAGVVSSTLGFASPSHAAVTYAPSTCDELAEDLSDLQASGGTLTADFAGTCDFAEGYIFQLATEIVGPTDGSLTLRFTGDREYTPVPVDYIGDGLTAQADLTISNLNFTRPSNSGDFDYFVYGWTSTTISNSTFSDAETSAAIYAEGNLTVSDSTFENLTSMEGGSAITSTFDATITNSTFANNTAGGQASGGAINSSGTLEISNSTFESNVAGNEGGAIFGNSPSQIDNSTFVGNNANNNAAFFLSEGSVISNSTFWNNGDVDTYSLFTDSSYFFGNILANDAPNIVKLFDPALSNIDLGANLYTDGSFDDITTGEGSSKRVTLDELKLSALALNSTKPVNTGKTKTVALRAGSVARDYYSSTSQGIDPTGNGSFATRIAALDQRGVAREPSVKRLDVGAFEAAVEPVIAPAPTTKATIAKQKIKFAPGSSRLSPASKKKLRALATEIQAKGLKNVSLEGYTATLTKAAPSGKVFRVKLSKARATAVEKYLKQQFKKKGYKVTFSKSAKGAANRVKSNKSEKGRIDNRRVEITIN